MERTKQGNELNFAGNTEIEGGLEPRALDVRALADLELVLVGGGDATNDWGG